MMIYSKGNLELFSSEFISTFSDQIILKSKIDFSFTIKSDLIEMNKFCDMCY